MNLKQLLDTCRIDRSGLTPYANLQIAYEEVANSIKINQHLFPVIMQKAFRNNGFSVKHKIGNDVICFKEIKSMDNTTLENNGNLTETVSDLEVFNYLEDEFHGIPEVRYSAVNVNHTLVPEIVIKGDIVECSNIDSEVFMFIFGYPYPYFVIPSGALVDDIDNYDIQAMVTTYGEQYLVVDDFLALLVIPKLLSIIEQCNGNVALASNYDYHFVQIVNKFNENRETFQHNNWLAYDTIPANV